MAWRRGTRLSLVDDKEAQGRTREIYDEFKDALGVPCVHALYQAYAAFPLFLDLHWRAVKPLLEMQAFFSLTERLRADAYTRMHNYFRIPDLCALVTDMSFSEGARAELTEVVELFHYVNPLMMLLAAAQLQAFENKVGAHHGSKPAINHPVFSRCPILIEEEIASAPVRKTYDDIKRVLGSPMLPADYCAFARWPDFLRAYWETLKPLLQAPMYQESLSGVRETAWNLVQELCHPVELTVDQLVEAGMDQDETASLVRITDSFVKVLSEQVLNVALAKIGIEGGNGVGGAEARPHQAA